MDLALLHAVLTAKSAFRRTQEARQMRALEREVLDFEVELAIWRTKSGAGR